MAEIVITVDDVDITTDVLYDTASFEAQMGALPGTFELTVKDSDRIYSFTTGTELTLDVDGTRLYGGYVTTVTEKFAFPVDLTADLDQVKTRQFVLRGVDYNILFDKRVLRNTADYTHHLGTYPAGSEIGALVQSPLTSDYLDIPAGFDTTSLVTATTTDAPDVIGAFVEQGSTWRKQMEDFARWGVVYYITADKQLYVKEVEESESKWMFSDRPNRLPIPVGYDYKPSIGFREGEFTEDGSMIINDALVWGGSEWSAGIKFARRQNADSIAEHGRWQMAETNFGLYKSQGQVNARANVIVDGSVSGTSGSLTRGYVNPQRSARVTWFAHLVPTDPNAGDIRTHLRPGDITTFILYTLGTDAAHPLILTLPLRSLNVTFPSLDPLGNGYVKFEGTFGLQLSDPWWLWKYLRDRRDDVAQTIIATSNGSEPDEPVSTGTSGGFPLTPAPDGSNTVFFLPNGYGYINGTTEVYVNGLRQFSPGNYTESDPQTGEITFTSAPVSTDQLYVVARLLASGGADAGGPGASTPPAVTHEYGGNGAGLQAFLDSVPDGAVVGLVANATYNLGTNGQIVLDTRQISMDMRFATIFRPNRGDTPIIQLQAGCHDFGWFNGTILGVKPDDQLWDVHFEHEHGISLAGVYNFEFSGINIRNVGGDGLYMGGNVSEDRWTADGRFHAGSINNCGRNAWSLTDGVERVVVDFNNITHSCYYVVDFEPNGYFIDGRPAGADLCRFSDNTMTGHVYGNHVADSSQTAGYAFAATGSSTIGGPYGGSIPLNTFIFARNDFVGSSMKCGSFNNNISVADLRFIDNTSDTNFIDDADFDDCISLSGVVGVTITGNTQPIGSGDFIHLSGCSGSIVTSPNTT